MLAKAYAKHHADDCASCGTRPEWWDPEQGGDRDAFIADIERCEGCARKGELQKQLKDNEPGVHVVLIPKAEYERRHARDD